MKFQYLNDTLLCLDTPSCCAELSQHGMSVHTSKRADISVIIVPCTISDQDMSVETMNQITTTTCEGIRSMQSNAQRTLMRERNDPVTPKHQRSHK